MKAWIISACLIVLVGLAAERVVIRHYLLPENPVAITGTPAASPAPTATAAPQSTVPPTDTVQRLSPPNISPRSANETPAPRPTPSAPRPARPQTPAQPAAQPQTPQARVAAGRTALASVGNNPAANSAWLQVINDDSVPPDERKNLIEDLNEDGFADPNNLTANDLPLIESRIAMIEQIAPDAMDDTNAAAFDEAYKDLQNMRDKLTADNR